MNKEIEIPEGYEARIEDNKVIIEPKESDDERIRKDILKALRYGFAREESVLIPGATTTLKEAIAYLEKQKDIESKYAGMVVVSQEEWDTAIADAFRHGMDEGEKQNEQKPAKWSDEDTLKLKGIINYLAFSNSPEGVERWIDFLESLPERFNLQPKQEWSKEDEETLACAISVFEDFAECKNVSVPPASAKRYLKRLKSLRPSWKPSEGADGGIKTKR